jgi:hypothetical protein
MFRVLYTIDECTLERKNLHLHSISNFYYYLFTVFCLFYRESSEKILQNNYNNKNYHLICIYFLIEFVGLLLLLVGVLFHFAQRLLCVFYTDLQIKHVPS